MWRLCRSGMGQHRQLNTMITRSIKDTAIPSTTPSSLQLTLALLKPDVCADNEQVQAIQQAINDASLTILARHSVLWTPDGAAAFYAEHKGRFFYERLCGYMSSGPFEALVLGGEQAIARWRALIGPTHPIRARVNAPTTLRAIYGLTDTRNSFHGSDSVETAIKEIKFFFPELDINQCIQTLYNHK